MATLRASLILARNIGLYVNFHYNLTVKAKGGGGGGGGGVWWKMNTMHLASVFKSFKYPATRGKGCES